MSELTRPMREFLMETRFAVLATINPNGTPQLSVMWYLLEGEELMFNTKRGRQKERNLARDPRVSFVVEDGYRFVRVTGRAVEVPDPDVGHRDIHRLAVRYQGEESAAKAMERFRREERVTYRIAVAEVYAAGF
jgi:PPOX class probable F420-dependent enzyme